MKKSLWPVWFPYPSSWLNALVLGLAAFPVGVVLYVVGYLSFLVLAVLSTFVTLPTILLTLVIAALLFSSPVFMLAWIHHFLWRKSLPAGGWGWLPGWRSLWEGFYGWLVIVLAVAVAFVIFMPFYFIPLYQLDQFRYYYWFRLTQKEVEWLGGVWLMTAAYFYQIEYIVKQRIMPHLKAALQRRTVCKASKEVNNIDALQQLRFSLPELRETRIPIAPQTPLQAPSKSTTVIPSPFTPNSSTSLPQNDSFREAVNKAMSAAIHAQSVQSPDDWKLVASQWRQAIALMQAVPSSSPKFAVAQQKVVEYQRNLDYARKKVEGDRQ